MKSDKAFSDVIIAIEDVDARLAAASSEGFVFTEAELKEVMSELNDEELDRVAGGGGHDAKWGLLGKIQAVMDAVLAIVRAVNFDIYRTSGKS